MFKSQDPRSIFQADRNFIKQRFNPLPPPPFQHWAVTESTRAVCPTGYSATIEVQSYHLSLSLQSTTAVPDSVLSWCHFLLDKRWALLPPGTTWVSPDTHPLKPAQQGQHPYFTGPLHPLPQRGVLGAAVAYSRPKSSL